MKSLPALAMAVILLAVPVLAQEPVATHLADDGAGDVKVDMQGQAAAPPQGSFDAADLKALDVTEYPDEFVFRLSVTDLEPDADAPFLGATLYSVHFLQNDRAYRIRIARQVFLTEGYFARLEGLDPGRGGYYNIGPLAVEVDVANNAILVTVPRSQMLDANGAAPHPSTPVTGFRATAQGMYTANRNSKLTSGVVGTATVIDAMPDSGNATTDLKVAFGVQQSGYARLASLIPTRASNGEATTFVFVVEATNLGPREDTFTLATTSLPATWSVKLPATQVKIPGNGTVSLPVLVTTPFTHTHGTFENFVLSMTSVNDARAIGRVQLGVRYMQPPQPAGHHSQLWFHSETISEDPATDALFQAFGVGSRAYMNAADQDPVDSGAEVPAENWGTSADNGTPMQHYMWEVPLSPGLEMGLDFDLARDGILQVNLGTVAPLPGAVLSGHLAHYGAPDQGEPGARPGSGPLTVLADLEPTAPMELGNGRHSVEMVLKVRSVADFVPFQRGASLMLVLNLTTTRVDAPFLATAAPTLVPGSTLTLPLFEYHDPVSDIFVSEVEVALHSRQDRFVNPGKTALFNLSVENRGASDATFLVEMTGTNLAWARLIPPQSLVQVPAGGSYAFHVAVTVPSDVRVATGAGSEKPSADIVVSVTNEADVGQRALVRLHTSVDGGNHRDDAALAASLDSQHSATEDTPLGAASALLAVALGVWVARRRR